MMSFATVHMTGGSLWVEVSTSLGVSPASRTAAVTARHTLWISEWGRSSAVSSSSE